jgi:hypothetical protein
MYDLAAFEKQIDNAIFALDYLKVEVSVSNVLYMLQYSSDNTKVDIQTWTTYCKVAENLRKRIAFYEESKREQEKGAKE